MPPDNASLPADEFETVEARLLEAAVAEARAGGPSIPHEQVRARMLEMIAEARARTAATQSEGTGQQPG